MSRRRCEVECECDSVANRILFSFLAENFNTILIGNVSTDHSTTILFWFETLYSNCKN